jgi:hypothetical protein
VKVEMLLAILGLLCGLVLGLRFDVLILLPAILLGWFVAMADGLIAGGSAGSIAVGMAVAAIALQAGYLFGVAAQWVVGLNGLRQPAEPPAVEVTGEAVETR